MALMNLRVALSDDGSTEHRRSLQELRDAGVSVPASWHPEVGDASAFGERRIWLSEAHPAAPLGLMVSISSSRRVPWARIAHIEHLGDPYLAKHASRIGQLIRVGAQQIGRVMRLEVRLLHREASIRESLAAGLADQGAHGVRHPAMYRSTRVLEVLGTSAQMFAKLPGVARRNICQPLNHGLLIKTNAVRERDVPRLLALMEATFARTGGHEHRDRWARDLLRAVRNPDHRPLATLERAEGSGGNAIVAFALGAHNGDHITYHHGAVDRSAGLGSLPLGYAPIWALVEWGVSRGVRWIDLGGITTSTDPSHPLQGITAFKRNFGGQDAIVADEMRLTLSPANVQLEKTLGVLLNR